MPPALLNALRVLGLWSICLGTLAQDPARGARLYLGLPGGQESCVECHGPDPGLNRNRLLNAAQGPQAIRKAIDQAAAMGYLGGLLEPAALRVQAALSSGDARDACLPGSAELDCARGTHGADRPADAGGHTGARPAGAYRATSGCIGRSRWRRVSASPCRHRCGSGVAGFGLAGRGAAVGARPGRRRSGQPGFSGRACPPC